VNRKKLLGGVLGFLAVSGLSMAFAELDFFPSNEKGTIEISHNLGYGSPGPATDLKVHRGPLSSGTYSMQFDLTIRATNVLSSAVLQTAMDNDGDGVLEDSEWTTVATAVIGQSMGSTSASTPWVNVSSSVDAYRVRYVRTDIGTTLEEWVSNPSKSLAP
jgi:hypothetical protein